MQERAYTEIFFAIRKNKIRGLEYRIVIFIVNFSQNCLFREKRVFDKQELGGAGNFLSDNKKKEELILELSTFFYITNKNSKNMWKSNKQFHIHDVATLKKFYS